MLLALPLQLLARHLVGGQSVPSASEKGVLPASIPRFKSIQNEVLYKLGTKRETPSQAEKRPVVVERLPLFHDSRKIVGKPFQ